MRTVQLRVSGEDTRRLETEEQTQFDQFGLVVVHLGLLTIHLEYVILAFMLCHCRMPHSLSSSSVQLLHHVFLIFVLISELILESWLVVSQGAEDPIPKYNTDNLQPVVREYTLRSTHPFAFRHGPARLFLVLHVSILRLSPDGYADVSESVVVERTCCHGDTAMHRAPRRASSRIWTVTHRSPRGQKIGRA